MRTKRSRFAGLVLVLGLIFSSPAPVSSPAIAEVTVTSTTLVAPSVVQKWEKVAWCEQHGHWYVEGPTFSGGLGISRVVWNEYGGQEFAPTPAMATKEQQVYVATRINKGFIPDQNGCNGAW
jgi:hypothetical protein